MGSVTLVSCVIKKTCCEIDFTKKTVCIIITGSNSLTGFVGMETFRWTLMQLKKQLKQCRVIWHWCLTGDDERFEFRWAIFKTAKYRLQSKVFDVHSKIMNAEEGEVAAPLYQLYVTTDIRSPKIEIFKIKGLWLFSLVTW